MKGRPPRDRAAGGFFLSGGGALRRRAPLSFLEAKSPKQDMPLDIIAGGAEGALDDFLF